MTAIPRWSAAPVEASAPAEPLQVLAQDRHGALVVEQRVRWQPSRRRATADTALAALAVLGATAVGLRWAARPAAVRSIAMGPGGWVSFKGQRPARDLRRPWWAVALRAQPLTERRRRR